MKQRRPLRVFLSFAAADKELAQRLRRLLSRRLNIRIFSTDMLNAGEDWKSQLRNELTQCDVFMVVVSPDSLDSKWVLQELGGAWALGKPIVPVVSHPDLISRVPVELSQFHLIEFKDLETPEVLNRVLDHYEEVAA